MSLSELVTSFRPVTWKMEVYLRTENTLEQTIEDIPQTFIMSGTANCAIDLPCRYLFLEFIPSFFG